MFSSNIETIFGLIVSIVGRVYVVVQRETTSPVCPLKVLHLCLNIVTTLIALDNQMNLLPT
jgi:hypothetical protein